MPYDGNESCIEVYYCKNDLLGNVIEILDTTGTTVVKYVYDAWGNHKVLNPDGTENTNAMFIGNINPIRYRSYYFDTETGLYFLQTRYYDPQTGRFINIDDISYFEPETINGLNLYAYCGNDPVNRFDPMGCAWSWSDFWKGLGMVVTAIGAIVLSVTTFGAGVPLAMSIVAGVTLGAGVLTGINGIATMIEAGTDYNFVRDGLFNDVLGLSDFAYNIYAGIAEGVAMVGSMILGFYHTTGQYKAAKYGQKYLGSGYKKAGYTNAGTPRYVSKDGARQMRFDGPHMYKGKRIGNHLNLEFFKGNKPIPYEHVLYNLFKYWVI